MFAITGQFVTSQVGWIVKITRAFRTFIINSLMFLFVTPQGRMRTEFQRLGQIVDRQNPDNVPVQHT